MATTRSQIGLALTTCKARVAWSNPPAVTIRPVALARPTAKRNGDKEKWERRGRYNLKLDATRQKTLKWFLNRNGSERGSSCSSATKRASGDDAITSTASAEP